MKDIESRKDINFLVNAFYGKIRKDELLGPIFNGHIPDTKWPEHLDKLTDFWEANLFGGSMFRGRPGQKHLMVDRNLNHSIEQKHFGVWLQLWFETITELYEGEVAIRAKETARKMAHGQFFLILNNRPI